MAATLRTMMVALAMIVLTAWCPQLAHAAGDPADGQVTVDDNLITVNQLQVLGTHNSYKEFPDLGIYVWGLPLHVTFG